MGTHCVGNRVAGPARAPLKVSEEVFNLHACVVDDATQQARPNIFAVVPRDDRHAAIRMAKDDVASVLADGSESGPRQRATDLPVGVCQPMKQAARWYLIAIYDSYYK